MSNGTSKGVGARLAHVILEFLSLTPAEQRCAFQTAVVRARGWKVLAEQLPFQADIIQSAFAENFSDLCSIEITEETLKALSILAAWKGLDR